MRQHREVNFLEFLLFRKLLNSLNRSSLAVIPGQQGFHLLARQNQLGGDFGSRDLLSWREDFRQHRRHQQLAQDREEHQVLRGSALRGYDGQRSV